MTPQKPSLIDTIKEWSSVILSGLGIVFIISLLRSKDNDTEALKGQIKDVEDNIKSIEESDPNIDEIINRWNNRNK